MFVSSPRSHREQPRTPPRVPTSAARMYHDPASPATAGLSPRSVLNNIPASPSPDLDDQLFDDFFDWEHYYQSLEEPYYPSPPRSPRSSPRSPPRSPPRSRASSHPLTDNINGIPAVTNQLNNLDFYNGMVSSSYGGSDEFATGSEYAFTPELVTGGSTSPSDYSSAASVDRFDDYRRPSSASLEDFQAHDDHWTYPQAHLSKAAPRGYPAHIQVTHHPVQVSSSGGLKRRHSGHSSEKRARHLADPNQTADVRKSGACLPCRVLKTRCLDNGICPTCRKAFPDHSHLVCNRMTPAMAWPVLGKAPDIWSSRAMEEEELCSGPRFHFGKPRSILVFFSPDPSSPPMKVVVQAYRSRETSHSGYESPTMVTFPREMVPSHSELRAWSEEQIKREDSADFRQCVQTFLLAYANDGEGLPKHGLVSKVHQLNCFFRIWKTPNFWCRDPANNITPLPLSVQAQLRNIARKSLKRIEHDILKDLDDCLSQSGAPKSQERMAIWACMWQLMLIYRDLVLGTKSYMAQVRHAELQEVESFYRKLTHTFYPLLTMFYHYQFRTKKSVEVSLEWMSSSYPSKARKSKRLHRAAQELVDGRRGFFQWLQSSGHEVDQLLSTLVVAHEIKKLNARKRPSKVASKSSPSYDEYDY